MNDNPKNTKTKLEPLAQLFQYELQGTDKRIGFTDPKSRILPVFESMSGEDVFTYFHVRTTSWDFDGERTDIHDALSFFAAVVLRIFDISCTLWDIPNSFSKIPTELYGRYITIAQPNPSSYRLNEQGIEQLKKLLLGARVFESTFASFFDWDPNIDPMRDTTYGWNDKETKAWARKVAQALGETLRSRRIQFNFRKNPFWLYYRTIAKKTSVYHASTLAKGVRKLIEESTEIKTIQGTTGTIYYSEFSRNVISYTSAQYARSILARIETQAAGEPLFLPMENHFLVVGDEHLICQAADCSLKIFDTEREHIRARRQLEEDLFFPSTAFHWSEEIIDERFESLIYDLLNIEPGVQKARKVGQTREGDEGRDIICEWLTPPLPGEPINEKEFTLAIRQVTVQCKVSKRNVGKSKVPGIYDMLQHHNYNGYFLAVSTHITVPLLRFLEGLRNKSIWTDWWTRSEIEDRLRRNPEVLRRYSDIVQMNIRE